MRRELSLMIGCLLALLGAVAALNVIANPYHAWPTAVVDDTYLRAPIGTERMTTPYRIRAESPTLLLVGTSRVLYGMRIEQGYRSGVLNAALSGGSLAETAALLDLALANPRLRHVVWGVEFVMFSEHLGGFRDEPTQERLEGDPALLVREALLSVDAVLASGQLLARAYGGRLRLPWRQLLPIPWPPRALREEFAALSAPADSDAHRTVFDAHLREWLQAYRSYRVSEQQWQLFRRTANRVRARGVELTLLVSPTSVYELETLRLTGRWPDLQAWKRELTAVGPYWDFSGYNELSRRDEFFTMPIFCHYTVAVGHSILHRVLGGDCSGCGALGEMVADAGVWVDRDTIEAHLAQQEAALRRATAGALRATREVERAQRTLDAEATDGGVPAS